VLANFELHEGVQVVEESASQKKSEEPGLPIPAFTVEVLAKFELKARGVIDRE